MAQPMLWTAFEDAAGLPVRGATVPWLSASENTHLARLKVPKKRDDWVLGRFTAKRLIQKAAESGLSRTLTPDEFEIATESSGALPAAAVPFSLPSLTSIR